MRISSSVSRYTTSALWIDRTVFAALSHNIESVFVFDIPIFLIVQALTSLWYFIYIFIDAMILLVNTYVASVQTLLFFVYFYLYILTFYTICRVCLIGFLKVKCTSLSRCADITWLQWRILDIKHQFWIDDERCCPLFVQTSSKSAAAIVLFMRFFA